MKTILKWMNKCDFSCACSECIKYTYTFLWYTIKKNKTNTHRQKYKIQMIQKRLQEKLKRLSPHDLYK